MSKWEPTHVQVTVHRGSSLLIKGKNGTNDCFVTIALGSTKFQTSVKEKANRDVEWHEECELPIPDQGNTAEIVLTALHRNFIGLDEFLGRCAIQLNQFHVYDKPRNRWYKLRSKPGREKDKERGELEVKVAFIVKSGSRVDLSEKKKKGITGSLTSLAGGKGRRISLRNVASSIGSKINMIGKDKKDHDFEDGSSVGSVNSLKRRTVCIEPSFRNRHSGNYREAENADPGVDTDEDDFTLDALSHNSSGSSLNVMGQRGGESGTGAVGPPLGGPSPEIPRRHTTVNVPSVKPPRNDLRAGVTASPTDTDQEFRTKWFGLAQKNNNSDSLKRRSWDSGRIDEEDGPEAPLSTTGLGTTTGTSTLTSSPTAPSLTNYPAHHQQQQQLQQLSSKGEPSPLLSKMRSAATSPKSKKTAQSPDMPAKPERTSVLRAFFGKDKSDDRIINGGENETPVSTHKYISNELLQKYEGKSREELILQVCNMQSDLDHNRKKLKDLEDYLDNLLLRVMETTPRILQNPEIQ